MSSIILGCTHFVFLKDTIQKIVGNNIKIVDGNKGTAKQLKRILDKYYTNKNTQNNFKIKIYNSNDKEPSLFLNQIKHKRSFVEIIKIKGK